MLPRDLQNLVSEFHRGDVRYRKRQVLNELGYIFQHLDDFMYNCSTLELLFEDLPYFLDTAAQCLI